MIAQRIVFRRLTVILCLMVTCAGLAILAPGRAQEGTQGDLYTIVVPAGDSMAFTLALVYANQYSEQNPGTFTIYLEGGTYSFEFPGSPQHPQLPSIRTQVVIQGNDAVLDLHLLNPLPHAEIAPLFILPTASLELHHLTIQIQGAGGRTVVNHGTLRLLDSVILNADPGIAEGGILNLGTLAVVRSTFEANQQRSASEGGGAILNRGSLVVSCSRFFDNEASQGGALYNGLGGTAQVDHTRFSGNRANGGGGIFNADGIPLAAGENFWGEGGDPLVDELLMGADTVSARVQFTPTLPTDPTQEAACQPPPPATPPAPTSSRMGLLSAPASVVPLPGALRYPLSYTGCMETVGTGLPTAWTCLNQIMPDATVSQITGLHLNSEPVWSPDGTKFAYQSWKTGRGELYIYDTLSQREITVTQNWSGVGEDIHPSWSPDGREILFDSSRYYGLYRDIYRAPADGSNPLNPIPLGYLDRATIKGHYPVFSPDGSMIAIAHNKDRSTIDTSTDVWLLRPNAYGEWRLNFRLTYHIGSGAPITRIAWNAAGTQLYYAQGSLMGQGSSIRLLESLDTAVYTGRTLADGAGFSRSPDGGQIAFLSQYDVDTFSYVSSPFLYLMNADGGNIRKLQAGFNPGLGGVGFRYLTPPLTGIIAYASNTDGDYEIYTVPADNLSAAPTRITDNSANDHDPAISPDGRYLVFVSDRGGQSSVYYQNMQDPPNSAILLTDVTGEESHLRWSPDGEYLAFNADNTVHVYNKSALSVGSVTKQGSVDYAPTWKDAQTLSFLSRTDITYRLCELTITTSSTPSCMVIPVRVEAVAWQTNELRPLVLVEYGQMLLAWIDLTASPLAVVPIATVSGAEDLILSPDGNFTAYTQAGTVHLLDLTGKVVGTIPNAVQPYWGAVYAPPTPTPTPTATPPPQPCIIHFDGTGGHQKAFLAPIGSNPPVVDAQGNALQVMGYPAYAVTLDKRSSDPLTGERWVHVVSQEDTTINGWVKRDSLLPGVTLAKERTDCLNSDSLLDVSTTYQIPNIAWDFPTFTQWPLDERWLNLNMGIWGLNKQSDNESVKATYPKGMHHGVDLFVNDNTAEIPVQSIGHGIVVGIGVDGVTKIFDDARNTDTHRIWGASENSTSGGTPKVGYAAIVRYGSLFVLYGHLDRISVWVGREVLTGETIGFLGWNNTRHLHLEVHHHGASLAAYYGGNIKYPSGILPLGGTYQTDAAPFVYEPIQFLPSPAGFNVQPGQALTFSTGTAVYSSDLTGLSTIDGYRGFNVRDRESHLVNPLPISVR